MDFRKTLPFKGYGEKKPICKLVIAHREPFSRTFWTNETQELLEAQPVSRILLQTLYYQCSWRKISEKKWQRRLPSTAIAINAHALLFIILALSISPLSLACVHCDALGCTVYVEPASKNSAEGFAL